MALYRNTQTIKIATVLHTTVLLGFLIEIGSVTTKEYKQLHAKGHINSYKVELEFTNSLLREDKIQGKFKPPEWASIDVSREHTMIKKQLDMFRVIGLILIFGIIGNLLSFADAQESCLSNSACLTSFAILLINGAIFTVLTTFYSALMCQKLAVWMTVLQRETYLRHGKSILIGCSCLSGMTIIVFVLILLEIRKQRKLRQRLQDQICAIDNSFTADRPSPRPRSRPTSLKLRTSSLPPYNQLIEEYLPSYSECIEKTNSGKKKLQQ